MKKPKQNIVMQLLNNKVARLCTAASSFRYITQLTVDYFYPAYMIMAFPQLRTKFLSYDALFTFCCGLFAALSGGVLAEKYGKKDPRNYARICAIGALIAWPCMVIGVMTTNFNLAIAMLFCRYTFGENFWSPNLQMIKNSCKSTEFGQYIGVYQFFNYLSGCLATLSVGYFSNALGPNKTAAGLGKIIAFSVSIGYGGSILCWWKVGNILKRRKDKAKKGFIINPADP